MRPGLAVVILRLAVRNAMRRKGEALLVVLGSLLGTAIITSSFIVGDTLNATIRDQARTRLGPIDEIALVHDAHQLDAVVQRITAKPLPGTDGVLQVTTSSVAVIAKSAVTGQQVAEPDGFVQELDFDAGRAFGGNVEDTGLADAGATPAADEAVLGVDLADELGVDVGDQIDVFAFGQTRTFKVRNFVPRLGVAGFHPGFHTRAPNIFVAPGTMAAMAAAAPPGAVLPEGRVLISNVGGVFDSTGPSDAVIRELQIRTAGLGPIEFTDEKQQTLAFADRQGRNFTRLFGLIGSFAVVAGVLLLINIFVMLSEERKSELGTLRALGFTRRHLIRVFGVEGTAYSLLAAALGVVTGIGVGAIVVRATEGIFAQGQRGIAELRFSVTPASLIAGFLTGLGIAMITVWGTSVRISRLNIIRAIRDSPEPPPEPRTARTLRPEIAGIAFGLAVLAFGLVATQPIAALLGPALVAACLVPVLSTRVPRRHAITLPCLGLLTYTVFAFTLVPSVFDNSDIQVFFVQGLVLVLSGVILAVTNDEQFHWVSNRLAAAGGGLATRLGLANPLAKRVRTGLLLGMYSLIVFVLVFMAIFAAVFQAQAPRITADTAAGFDLRVDSNPGNPVTPALLQKDAAVAVAVPLVRADAEFQTSADQTPVPQRVTGFDMTLLANGGPKLTARDARYPTDQAAWQAVLDSPEFAVVPADFFGSGGNGPARASVHVGQRVMLVNTATGRRHPLTIVGLVGSLDPAENGAMVASGNLPTFVERTSASRFYVEVKPGQHPDDVARHLQGALVAYGVKADTFGSLVDDRLSGQAQFISLLEGFLSLGLLIGIAGLGVVMVRAVRERRREIGMLRAMGCPAGVVRRAFMIEASFIAVQGILIGAVLGLITGFSVLGSSSTFGGEALPFTVPWTTLILLSVAALVASLLAVSAPATQASRVKPAVALRMTD
jgi:putative ABC transport system permease protein